MNARVKLLQVILAFLVPLFIEAQVAEKPSESWKELKDRGDKLAAAGTFDQAVPILEEARARALREFGKENNNYIESLLALVGPYLNMQNDSRMEPLCLELLEILPKAQEKKYDGYDGQLMFLLGDVYRRKGDYIKAEVQYLSAQEIIVKGGGKETFNNAAVLKNLGLTYQGMGNFSKAEPLYRESMEIVARIQGKENRLYAASLNGLGLLYYQTGDFAKAEPLEVEALQIRRKVLGTMHPEYLESLNGLAQLYLSMGDYPKAEQLLKELKGILEVAVGKQHAGYAECLNTLATVYHKMGDFVQAEALFQEALAITKPVGSASSSYARYLAGLGLLYLDMGDFSKAEPLLLETREISAKVLGKEHPEYATAQNNLGWLYYNVGNYSKAEKMYMESKDIRARTLGTVNNDYAGSLNNLAMVYQVTGNYSKAEAFFQESKEIVQKLVGKAHPLYALSLNNLATLYHEMGNFVQAEEFFQASMEISRKVLGSEHPTYAASLNNLAALYIDMAKYPQAEQLFLQSKGIYLKVFGNQHPAYAACLNNLAKLYTEMSDYAKAEQSLVESREINYKLYGKEDYRYAISLIGLSSLYIKMGSYDKAEPLLLEAQPIMITVLGKEHPYYTICVNKLAKLYDAMGNASKAEPFYLEAIAKTQKQIALYFPSLSEKEKQAYYSMNKVSFEAFESFSLGRFAQNQNVVGDLYNLKLTTKGLLFNASNKVRQRILSSKDTVLINAYNDWKSKKDFLAKVYPMPLLEKQKKGIDENLLEEQANTLEKKLSQKSALFATAVDQRQYTWEDVKQKLKSGEAAIEVVKTTKKLNDKEVVVYAIMIVKRGTVNHPELVVLENGDDLENKFSKYYRSAVKEEITDEVSYHQFWKPISDQLKGIKRVYLSTDGVYNQINLNTLYNPVTGKYVMDELEVHMVTSTRDLLTSSKKANTKVKNTTLFGYPDYNRSKPAQSDSSRSVSFFTMPVTRELKSDSAQRFVSGDAINELPGTKVEVETISGLLRKKGIPIHEYLFEAATEVEVKRLSNPQVLHVATHGFFLSDMKESSQGDRGFAGIEAKKFVENPLLRSGLLFAGAKDAFTRKEGEGGGMSEDGILTAYEAMNLNLDQTDLVVMSACETGLGVSSNGEGVYGLQRAFQVAGAKTVMMSLWKVSDEATQQLMTLFYESWLGGKPPHEAFRLAQVALREKHPEPFYWGAFVLVGR